jgi:sigma-B regulation protein RsbU (phosphoserine phosphatase)
MSYPNREHGSAGSNASILAEAELQRAFGLLAEMTRRFADSLEIEPVLLPALQSICSEIGAEAGSLWLVDEETDEVVCRACVGLHEMTGLRLALDHGIVGRCVRENSRQSVLDVSLDPEFVASVDQDSGMKTQSILCAPMSVSDHAVGAIELVNRVGGDGRFSDNDLYVLEVLASSAGLAIANARMATEASEHRRVQRELELAAEIQRALIPAEPLRTFPVSGRNIPARSVSGDFYDYLTVEGGRIAFCLGDVSGKGMNAALLMAKTASLYRCLAKTVHSPGRLLGMLNEELAETALRGMFVTMVAGLLDPKTGEVIIANAGHEPPLHRDCEGTFCDYPAVEPPLGISVGILPDGVYTESKLMLDGGALFLFSDGLTEACLDGGDPLGAEGLQALIQRHAGILMSECVGQVMDDVDRLEHRDDLTLLGVGHIEAPKVTPVRADRTLLEQKFFARPEELRRVRDAMRVALREESVGESWLADVVAAVDEACQNIVRHAYGGTGEGQFELKLEREGQNLVIVLHDGAPRVDPEVLNAGRGLDDVRPGGLGTHFMRELMDEVAFVKIPSSGDGNLLRMVKKIP